MIKERINHFLNKEGVSPSQFAEVLGIQRSSMSHILSGRNKPSYDFFERLIKKYPNVNLEWFFNGTGNLYKEDRKENDKNILINEVNELPLNSIKQNQNSEYNTYVNNIKKVLLLFTNGTFEVFDGMD